MKFNKKFLAVLLSASLIISGCGVEKGNPGSSASSPIFLNMSGTSLTFQSINSTINLTYSNNATQYLDGTGNWTVPPGGNVSSNHTHSPGNITGGTQNQTIISNGTRGQWFTPVVAWISDYVSDITSRLATYVGGITTTNNSQVGYRVTWNGTAYVLSPPSFAGELTYYFQNSSANYSNYKRLLTTIESTKTTNTTAGVTNNQTLANFITDAGSPNLDIIPAGSFDIHLHASQTAGTQATTIHPEIWETAANGTDIAMIGMAEPTATLTGTETEYSLVFINNNPYTLNSTSSRILVRLHAYVTGGGSAPTVNIYFGGLADSAILFPSSTVASNTFLLTANVTTTPTANKVPAANTSGKLNEGWINRAWAIDLFSANGSVTVQNNTKTFCVPDFLNGFNVTSVWAMDTTNSTSGNVTVNIYNVRLAQYIMTTALSIDANEGTSYTAAVPAVLSGNLTGLQTGDILRYDVIFAGTGTKGLQVGVMVSKP